MKFSQATVNNTTNTAGIIIGLPQILQGIPLLLAGDYIGGGVLVLQGLSSLIGFYFIGK